MPLIFKYGHGSNCFLLSLFAVLPSLQNKFLKTQCHCLPVIKCSRHYNCADKKAFKEKVFLLSVEAERILLYIVLTLALGGLNVVLRSLTGRNEIHLACFTLIMSTRSVIPIATATKINVIIVKNIKI